jgi:excisionase family DNA binding protein
LAISKIDALLTPSEVADQLQVSLRTVRRLIDTGKISALRVGRLIRIRPAALEAYLTEAAGK